MTSSNVVPFRRRAPSKQELEVYHWMTRSWSPAMRRLLFPEFHRFEAQASGQRTRTQR